MNKKRCVVLGLLIGAMTLQVGITGDRFDFYAVTEQLRGPQFEFLSRGFGINLATQEIVQISEPANYANTAGIWVCGSERSQVFLVGGNGEPDRQTVLSLAPNGEEIYRELIGGHAFDEFNRTSTTFFPAIAKVSTFLDLIYGVTVSGNQIFKVDVRNPISSFQTIYLNEEFHLPAVPQILTFARTTSAEKHRIFFADSNNQGVFSASIDRRSRERGSRSLKFVTTPETVGLTAFCHPPNRPQMYTGGFRGLSRVENPSSDPQDWVVTDLNPQLQALGLGAPIVREIACHDNGLVALLLYGWPYQLVILEDVSGHLVLKENKRLSDPNSYPFVSKLRFFINGDLLTSEVRGDNYSGIAHYAYTDGKFPERHFYSHDPGFEIRTLTGFLEAMYSDRSQ